MASLEHARMDQFSVQDGHLHVGGISLARLAARVGRTPFYAYDRALLTARVRELRSILPPAVELHYAMKANPMPALVCHMATLVDGIDVASAAEMRVALDSGMAASEISFAGPGKTAGELAQAVASGVLVNAESKREIEIVAAAACELGMPGRIAIRVNPDFELKLSGMKMGGGPKQFGIDAEAVPEILDLVGALGLQFEGFHIFSGSQSLKADSLCEAQTKTLDLAVRLAMRAPGKVRTINIGGGFGIPYFPGERRLDLAPVAENLARQVEATRKTLPEARIVMELGRFLVGEAGVYICRIIDRKISRGQVFLIVDGGLHHNLAASGNFGQVLRKNYPVAIANRMDAMDREIASVVGPLCTPLDLLADRMDLAKADVGDLVAVFQAGAYGPSASPARFLSHPDALEILV